MKLVLTGGPSGGKTTLANLMQKEFGGRIVIVPEAASILFGGGFPRRPTRNAVQHRQKAIYFVQRELEGIVQDEFPDSLLVCDRGSLDGIAYWPSPTIGSDARSIGPTEAVQGSEPEFLGSVGTTLGHELTRYDYVMHLDTAPEEHYDLTNKLRIESFHEAWALNERVKAAWSQHPRRFIIANGPSGHFVDKLTRALTVIDDLLKGRSYEEILAHLGPEAQTLPSTRTLAISNEPSAETMAILAGLPNDKHRA